jgi:hypothetical protein
MYVTFGPPYAINVHSIVYTSFSSPHAVAWQHSISLKRLGGRRRAGRQVRSYWGIRLARRQRTRHTHTLAVLTETSEKTPRYYQDIKLAAWFHPHWRMPRRSPGVWLHSGSFNFRNPFGCHSASNFLISSSSSPCQWVGPHVDPFRSQHPEVSSVVILGSFCLFACSMLYIEYNDILNLI